MNACFLFGYAWGLLAAALSILTWVLIRRLGRPRKGG